MNQLGDQNSEPSAVRPNPNPTLQTINHLQTDGRQGTLQSRALTACLRPYVRRKRGYIVRQREHTVRQRTVQQSRDENAGAGAARIRVSFDAILASH